TGLLTTGLLLAAVLLTTGLLTTGLLLATRLLAAARGPGAAAVVVVGSVVALPGIAARPVAAAHRAGPRSTSWPGAAPVRRSVSSAASSSTAAAAESTVCRRSRESCPLARSASCAVDVVKRSSTSRTGSGATLAARSAANFLAETAAGPSRPDRDRGRPTKISIAFSVAASEARASMSPLPRRTTVSGVASTPPGSLRATPMRTVPGSTARRTPLLTGLPVRQKTCPHVTWQFARCPAGRYECCQTRHSPQQSQHRQHHRPARCRAYRRRRPRGPWPQCLPGCPRTGRDRAPLRSWR